MYDDWAREQGLSSNSALILYYLYEAKESCTQKSISQMRSIPKQTVNTILKDFSANGYFVGNTIGDSGLSAINIAYPIVALIQAVGTGIGMGGAVYYSINVAEGNHQKAGQFVVASW